MRPYLTFVLHAPLASFGAVAVGERRGGDARPGRSALLGLLAAALGIERQDEATHAAIEAGYGVAVRVDAAGTLLSDYHTAQVPPARFGRHATRADELAVPKPELSTILSRRDYRTDSLFTIAVWARDAAPFPLERLGDALRRPAFALCVGRKSCPLGLPPAPHVGDAADALAAMAARPVPEPERAIRQRLRATPTRLATEVDDIPAGHTARWVERRRDAIASRARWQFGLRQEAVIDLTPEGP